MPFDVGKGHREVSSFEMSHEKTNNWVFSEQVRATQVQKMARDWKFWMNCTIHVAKTQVLISFAGYREAGLRLCFCIMQIVGFLMRSRLFAYLKCALFTIKHGHDLIAFIIKETSEQNHTETSIISFHVQQGLRSAEYLPILIS